MVGFLFNLQNIFVLYDKYEWAQPFTWICWIDAITGVPPGAPQISTQEYKIGFHVDETQPKLTVTSLV